MKTKIATLIMVMLFALILCSVVSAADTEDSPTGLADTSWPKFQGDINNTGQSNYTGPQNNTTEWTYTTPNVVNQNSNIVVGADGTIYFGLKSSSYLYALYSNGTPKWNLSTSAPVFSLAIGKNGIIYGSSSSGSGKYVYAFKDNGNNATLMWTYSAGSGVRSISIGPDGTIYFGTQSGDFNALIDNGNSAQPKWTSPFHTEGIIYGTPAIGADGTIYLGSMDQYLYALNPDGTPKWKYKTGGSIQNAPVIGADGTIYVGSGDGIVYAFSPVQDDPENPKYKWIYPTNNGTITNSAPSVAKDGTIYIGTGSSAVTSGKVFALIDNGTQATEKWTYSTGAIQSSAVIGADGTVYIGSNDGYVYAFNPDGSLKWKYKTGLQVYNLALGANGALYFSSGLSNGNFRFYSIKDPAPVANFTANITNGSSPLTVKFNDTSAGIVTGCLWDFGDSTTSTEQNPTHTYTKPGTYTVKLTVTNNNGSDSSTETKTEYITVLKSNVYVKVTASKTNPQVGDKVTYTFKLGNNGPGIARDVVFTYVIPEGLEFAGAKVDQGTWDYNETTRTLTWNMSEVAVGDPYLWLDLRVLNAGNFNINPTVSVSGTALEANIGSLLVNAASASNAVTVNAATKTIPMQETGVPLTGLTMALLLVGSGLALARRK